MQGENMRILATNERLTSGRDLAINFWGMDYDVWDITNK